MAVRRQYTALQIDHLRDHGRHAIGDGLYLEIDSSGKRWLLRYQLKGKRTWFGLGGYHKKKNSLSLARQKASEAKLLVSRGLHPVEQNKAQKLAEDEALARLLEEEREEKERQRRIEQQKEKERIKQAEAERKKLERERLAAQLEKAKADAAAKEEEERLAKARREREAAKRERARIQAARVAKQQKVAHLMPANFFSGSLRLKSGFSAGYKNGNVRNLISGALTRGDYVRLANLVVGTVPNGQNYYLLGRAAEGYEAHAAALTYYRTALRMNEDCLGACAIGYSRSIVLDAIKRVSAAM